MRLTTNGFTLPLVMLVSVGLMIIGVSLARSTSAISGALNTQYVNQITGEASEAGVAYATYCLGQNDFVQTWGPALGRPTLKPNTDCNGTTISGMSDTIMSSGPYTTTFAVGDLEVRTNDIIIINSTGTSKTTANSITTTRLNSSKKQVLKWNQFKPSVSASGTAKTCAIVSDELYCWGQNSDVGFDGSPTENYSGQLGDGTTTNSSVPVKVRQDPGVLQGKKVSDISSAQHHNCALAEGKIYCWGRNDYGQLGQGSATPSTIPYPVEVKGALLGKTVTAIGASGDTSCAIAGGKIYCWGRNDDPINGNKPFGTVGINSAVTSVPTPTLVYAPGGTGLSATYTATKLASGGSRSYNMCALADGKVYCWGENKSGQIGNGDNTYTAALYPTAVRANVGDALNGKTITALSQDGYNSANSTLPHGHVCVVADAKAYCWGDNLSGELGTGNTTSSNVPVAVSTTGALSGKNILDIVVGLRHTCALASDNKMYCWGYGGQGVLGTGSYASSSSPVAVRSNSGDALYGKSISKIGGGSNRSCAISGIRSYCWGLNSAAQLGDGTTISPRNLPVESVFLRPKAPAFMF